MMLGTLVKYPSEGRYAISWTGMMRLPACYPVIFSFNTGHWHFNGTNHGPQSNPAIATARLVKLGVNRPSGGRRLWLYFRGGYAVHADIYIDRRALYSRRPA